MAEGNTVIEKTEKDYEEEIVLLKQKLNKKKIDNELMKNSSMYNELFKITFKTSPDEIVESFWIKIDKSKLKYSEIYFMRETDFKYHKVKYMGEWDEKTEYLDQGFTKDWFKLKTEQQIMTWNMKLNSRKKTIFIKNKAYIFKRLDEGKKGLVKVMTEYMSYNPQKWWCPLYTYKKVFSIKRQRFFFKGTDGEVKNGNVIVLPEKKADLWDCTFVEKIV